jgi:polygalacturonase
MLNILFQTILISAALLAPSMAQSHTKNQILNNSKETKPATFNVRRYGAKGDGKALDHISINKAIEACAKAGGGTVQLPAGKYLCGSIRLKSNINLYLDAGAVIVGAPQEMNAYDASEPFPFAAFQDGGHTYFHNSLIWGENLVNVSITGTGMIDGGGLVRDDGPQNYINGYVYLSKKKVEPYPGPLPDISTVRLGNKAIALKLCRNVLIRDITIFHGGHFAILATGVDGLTIDNVTIDTNRDGIDIDCCRNVTVSNCRINSPTDDALCPKSSYALGRNIITENLTITNCQVSGFKEGTLLDGTMQPAPDGNGNGRIKLGTEANGGFRNITISNCTFRSCRGLALEQVDGGIMENITISNIAMFDVPIYAIYITTGRRNRGPNVTTNSSAKNILISNVVATGVDQKNGIIITGIEEQPIENLRLENIRLVLNGGGTKEQAKATYIELDTAYPEPRGITPSYGIFARHVNDLELANIRLTSLKPDERPAISLVNIKGVEIDNFKADIAPDIPAITLDRVRDMVVRNSPVLETEISVSKLTTTKSGSAK